MSTTYAIDSQRGGKQIVYNNFIYVKKKETTITTTWICSEKELKLRATSSRVEEEYDTSFIAKEEPQNHDNSYSKIEKDKILLKMKES